MGEPLEHVGPAIYLPKEGLELLRCHLGIAPKPSDDFLVHVPVPLLVATVRLLIHGSGDEARIARFVMATQRFMLFQRLGDRPGDDMVLLPLALGRLGRSRG
jgi:hypothetical protein